MGDEIYAYVYVWLGSHAVHWGKKSVSEITIKTKLKKKKREREMKTGGVIYAAKVKKCKYNNKNVNSYPLSLIITQGLESKNNC